MKLVFTKMHGLGNDFVVVNATQRGWDLPFSSIRAMADRNTGIGFDQLLVLEATTVPEADFAYRIFNADGNEVEQCGNGARCVGLFIQQEGLSDRSAWTLATRTGVMRVIAKKNNDFAVEFPPPKFTCPQGLLSRPRAFEHRLSVAGHHCSVYLVNVGNPHAVMIVDALDEQQIITLGEKICCHVDFPAGINVGFMKIDDRNGIRLRVYERGVGCTLACGSGAMAAAAVGVDQGYLDKTVTVRQAGGELLVHWAVGAEKLVLEGPACHVYRGVYAPR